MHSESSGSFVSKLARLNGILPLAYSTSRRSIFAKASAHGFTKDARALIAALEDTHKAIINADSLDTIPPFTDIAVAYGALLTRVVLLSFVKGHDNARKRKYRSNSVSVDDLYQFSWNLQITAALAAFSRQAFVMASVQTEELRSTLFEEAKAVFASGGSYRDWADTFSLHGFEPDNPFHLRTNYDTAANAAYSAGQWQQIEENKALFPYLRYVTMQDNKVRDEHVALNGLVFPVDDPFWDTYMPPNDWNCRCSVEQLMQSELPDTPQPNLADYPLPINPQFQNNPGKTNLLNIYAQALGAPQTSWDNAGFPAFSSYPKSDPINPLKSDNLSPDELLHTYYNALQNRVILDVNNVPVIIDPSKASKLDNYSSAALRSRIKYVNCLDDLISHPQEAWLNPDTRRIYYLKRYDKDIVAIAEIESDNVLRYFNIMTSTNITASIRSGIPLFKQ